jgi:hypothetical protein
MCPTFCRHITSSSLLGHNFGRSRVRFVSFCGRSGNAERLRVGVLSRTSHARNDAGSRRRAYDR